MPLNVAVDPETFNDVTHQILGAAIEVHKTLGPGLLESIYTPCLEYEFTQRKLTFASQRVLPIVYKNLAIRSHYTVDLLVEELVVVEVKCVATLLPIHYAQALTYMKLLHCPAGLVINFNVPRLMDGVKRLINPAGSDRSTGRGPTS